VYQSGLYKKLRTRSLVHSSSHTLRTRCLSKMSMQKTAWFAWLSAYAHTVLKLMSNSSKSPCVAEHSKLVYGLWGQLKLKIHPGYRRRGASEVFISPLTFPRFFFFIFLFTLRVLLRGTPAAFVCAKSPYWKRTWYGGIKRQEPSNAQAATQHYTCIQKKSQTGVMFSSSFLCSARGTESRHCIARCLPG
jgi:hypothetical protein